MHIKLPPFGRVLVLYGAGLGAAAQFSKMAVILPQMALAYPEAGSVLGFLVSLISLLGIGLGLMAGLVAQRVGLRRLVIGSLLLGALISGLQSFLPPLVPMLILRVIEGAAHLGLVVAAPTLIAQISPNKLRPLSMTLWGTFFGVAFALTAWGGIPLADAYGPGPLFVLHAIWMLVMAAAVALVIPSVVAPPAPRIDGMLQSHIRVYSSAFLSAPAIGWLFYTLTFVSLLAVMPGTLPPEDRLLVAGIAPLAGIVTSMTLGVVLLRVMSAVHVIVFGFLMALGLVGVMVAQPANPIVLITLFAALGLVQGASFAAVPQLNETTADRALANGAMAQQGNLGNTLGTPVVLAILGFGGTNGVLVLLALCYALGAGLHLFFAAKRKRLIQL